MNIEYNLEMEPSNLEKAIGLVLNAKTYRELEVAWNIRIARQFPSIKIEWTARDYKKSDYSQQKGVYTLTIKDKDEYPSTVDIKVLIKFNSKDDPIHLEFL